MLDYYSPQQSAAEREEARGAQIARVQGEHPQLADIPPDYFAETRGVHNPGGPPVRLAPPMRPASPVDRAEPRTPPGHHVIDLSQPTFSLPGKTKPYPISEETASHARQYAAISNRWLDHERTQGRRRTVINPAKTATASGTSVGKAASAITARERERAPHAYGERHHYVGHLPDSSASGVAHSPMGFMGITPEANTLVGYGSNIGAMTGRPIEGMVVREATGRVHRYQPKSPSMGAAAAPDPHTAHAAPPFPAPAPPFMPHPSAAADPHVAHPLLPNPAPPVVPHESAAAPADPRVAHPHLPNPAPPVRPHESAAAAPTPPDSEED
ncbi:MAG TPA: hypothetical protein VGS22_19730 [Thermoanaerobaculia bacterium]|jgi:hypothetical protein|nr:hypothetical protein [Thermoanaerobaculia bacterium]